MILPTPATLIAVAWAKYSIFYLASDSPKSGVDFNLVAD